MTPHESSNQKRYPTETTPNNTFIGSTGSIVTNMVDTVTDWIMRKPNTTMCFLPDFTEHPKPKKHKILPENPPISNIIFTKDDDDDDHTSDVTFLHDFVAGGAAGSASVIVGHPFDTLKVRMQTATTNITVGHMIRNIGEYGGLAGLFRGMGAPLAAASAINAIVFTSYGISSRFYDQYIYAPETFIHHQANHDPWQKSSVCGMFAGFVQCVIIAPMEHVKCRLQTQLGSAQAKEAAAVTTGTGPKLTTNAQSPKFTGPLQTIRYITKNYGVSRLFQGWWATILREVPCFGLYFASYDYVKDRANKYLAQQAGMDLQELQLDPTADLQHSHTWLASAFAGGMAGCLTWGIAYPVDVIKSRIQTAPLNTPREDLRILSMAKKIIAERGVAYLYRGISVTLVRAFPVNGTIFPVYEWTLMRVTEWTDAR